MKTTTKNRTITNSYISGGICGHLWMPAVMGGKPLNKSLRGPWGFHTKGNTLRESLNSLLIREGGDFQDSRFTGDTVVRFEMTVHDGPGRYHVRVKEITLVDQPDLKDLVCEETFVSDFSGEE